MKLKHKLQLIRYRDLCRKWKKCVNLTWNMEWPLCSDKKCPCSISIGAIRAYKRTIGTYNEKEDIWS